MVTRIAIIGIIVEDASSIKDVNGLLNQYSEYIIGRMGLPYRQKEVSIITVVIDAPQDIINSLSGKIGKFDKISAKTLYSNKEYEV